MLDTLSKLPCCECNSMAVWMYVPGHGGYLEDDFYCDEHVPRGCDCQVELKPGVEPIWDEHGNIINDNEDDYYHLTDGNGEFLPCTEYVFSLGGFNASFTEN